MSIAEAIELRIAKNNEVDKKECENRSKKQCIFLCLDHSTKSCVDLPSGR